MSVLFNFAKATGSLVNLPTSLGDFFTFGGGGRDSGSANNMNVSGSNTPSSATFAFEQVAAVLTPFQFPQNLTRQATSHPLFPILETGGVVFPYNPSISEGVSMKYDQIELTHTNESYYSWRGTDNVRINISDAVWTCDTFDNAIYAMSVLHFFRSYSFMDFGRFKTGRPPSPMWFSAYGNYAFNRVPCLLEKADWSFPNDIDYIGVPEFNSPEYQNKILQTERDATGNYTWLPVKFTISSISLIVQHSPVYWINWDLEDYWSGAMLERDGTFHRTGPAADDTTAFIPPLPTAGGAIPVPAGPATTLPGRPEADLLAELAEVDDAIAMLEFQLQNEQARKAAAVAATEGERARQAALLDDESA